MKHIFTLLFAVLAFAACTQNDVDELSAVRQDLPQTLTVGFEADDTRIQLNEAGKTVWTKDDLVSVFYLSNANQKWQYQGETGERVGVLKCVESVLSTKETDYVVVAYPYNDNYYLNASSCNLRASLPATQHYAKDSYGLDGNIMVSRSEYNQVSLRNVCGWLKVQLAGDNQVVKSIKLYGNNGEQVAGELYINTNDATAILASDMGIMPDSDEEGAGGVGGGLHFNNTIYTDVTLVCDEEVVLGNKATAFYIALPPQTFENGVTVEVKCKGYEPMVISTDKELTIQRNHIRPMETVKFEAASEAVSDATFTFKNIDVTTDYFSYALDVIPSDKELPFIVMSASSDYIEASELQSDEALFADDYSYFEWIGTYFGMSALEVMKSRAKFGNVYGIRVNDATPGDDYIFYAYYIDPASGALASKIARCEITAGHPELGQASFNFTYEIDGPDVFIQVDPVGFEGDYYFDVMAAEELAAAEKAGYTKEEYFVKWWASIVSDLKSGGYSVDEILAENTCWGEDRNTWDYELMANSTYYVFAFKLEGNSLCCSTPKYEMFTTGDAVMSDNEIKTVVTNVTSTTATFTLLTSIAEDPYSFSWATAAEWASYGSTDEERVNNLLKESVFDIYRGDESLYVMYLLPSTEYVLYAFGNHGGVATTPVSVAKFTTPSDAIGEASISFKDLGYYYAQDLIYLPGWSFLDSYVYEGKVIYPIELDIQPANHGAYMYEIYFWGDHTDEYNDEQYLDGLLWWIGNYGSLTANYSYRTLDFNCRYVAVAIVVDANGQYSELYKKEIYCTHDGVNTDIEAFANWWDAMQSGSSLSSVYSYNKPMQQKAQRNNVKMSEKPAVVRENKAIEADIITATRF